MNNPRLSALHLSHLADQAERFMLVTYERLPNSLVLHNDSWAIALAAHSLEIALRRPGVSPDLPHLARTVALLDACRYWTPAGDLKDWKVVAREFRDWTGPDYQQLQMTLFAVLPGGSSGLRGEVADVLYDAKLAQRILSGAEGAELTWLEDRYFNDHGLGGHEVDRLNSHSRYLAELRQACFRDGELRRGYQHTHSAVLLDLQQLVDRLGEKQKKQAALTAPVVGGTLDGLERGPTRQASQTYFRTVFRNKIQMKRMADQKAAIIVSVNAVLVGGLITFVSYRNLAQTKPALLMPIAAFVVCALTSLVYAIISSRPHHRPGEEDNLAFYGTISKLPRADFAERMEELLLDPGALYGNLIAELHGLGCAIERKFRLLRIAYNIFLAGLLVSVFLAAAVFFFLL